MKKHWLLNARLFWWATKNRAPLPFLASGEPMRALVAEFAATPRLVLGDLFRRQRLAPPSVDALVDEHLCTCVPKRPAQRHGFCGILLHPVKRTVLHNGLPTCFFDWDIEKFSDATYLSGRVVLEIGEVNELHVGEIANRPPAPDIFPE